MRKLYKKVSDYMNYGLNDCAKTADGWAEAYQEFKKNAPVRYFIVRVLKRGMDDAWMKLKRPFRSVYDFFYYRFIDRYHVVDTGLAPGYHDKDRLMLHACFGLLVDYVEIELASGMYRSLNEEQKHAHDTQMKPYKRLPFLKRLLFRSPSLGIQMLQNRIEEVSGELLEFMQASGGTATESIKECREVLENDKAVLELYQWWTTERPELINEIDTSECPMQAEIDEACKGKGLLYTLGDQFRIEYPLLHKAHEDHMDRIYRLETLLQEQEDENFKKLIEIHRTLWT